MKKLFQTIRDCMKAGEDVVLVTIIAGSGSTPREAGARMVITKNGLVSGTIGGGAVEYRSQQIAADILKEKKSHEKGFKLKPNQVEDLGMICGGEVVVYFQYIAAEDAETLVLIEKILTLFQRDEDAWIITDISNESVWSMGAYSKSAGMIGLSLTLEEAKPLLMNRSVQAEVEGKRYHSEPLVRSGKVIVFGGGHVAQELVPVLSHIGFRCLVMDDREEFASKKLFPTADEIILGSFEKITDSVAIEQNDYVVVMTRGHAHDYIVQEQVLRFPSTYVGVIGSRSKIAAVSAKLREAGIPRKEIERIHAPIGLAIKAETPAEIAVSIAGELIQVRAEHMGK